jgi:hypothetical protein
MFKYLLLSLFLLVSWGCHATYTIVYHYTETYYQEIHVFLIHDDMSNKTNAYVCGLFSLDIPYDVEEIICKFKPLPLDIAQRNFKEYNFTKENYGF